MQKQLCSVQLPALHAWILILCPSTPMRLQRNSGCVQVRRWWAQIPAVVIDTQGFDWTRECLKAWHQLHEPTSSTRGRDSQ